MATYLLRRIPDDLHKRVTSAVIRQDTTVRRVLLEALIRYDAQVARDEATAVAPHCPQCGVELTPAKP